MEKSIKLIFLTIILLGVLVSCSADNVINSFKATILEINGDTVMVRPLAGEEILRSSDKITFVKPDEIGASVDDTVIVKYKGHVRETYPAQVDAISWSIISSE
jgi:hypothetical protein